MANIHNDRIALFRAFSFTAGLGSELEDSKRDAECSLSCRACGTVYDPPSGRAAKTPCTRLSTLVIGQLKTFELSKIIIGDDLSCACGHSIGSGFLLSHPKNPKPDLLCVGSVCVNHVVDLGGEESSFGRLIANTSRFLSTFSTKKLTYVDAGCSKTMQKFFEEHIIKNIEVSSKNPEGVKVWVKREVDRRPSFLSMLKNKATLKWATEFVTAGSKASQRRLDAMEDPAVSNSVKLSITNFMLFAQVVMKNNFAIAGDLVRSATKAVAPPETRGRPQLKDPEFFDIVEKYKRRKALGWACSSPSASCKCEHCALSVEFYAKDRLYRNRVSSAAVYVPKKARLGSP